MAIEAVPVAAPALQFGALIRQVALEETVPKTFPALQETSTSAAEQVKALLLQDNVHVAAGWKPA